MVVSDNDERDGIEAGGDMLNGAGGIGDGNEIEGAWAMGDIGVGLGWG